MSNVVLPVTFFNSPGARFKDERVLSLDELAELIRYTQAESKDQLPWLKLAQFGAVVTAKGSLRHDANVVAVSGCEADYDAGSMTVDEALERLEKAGVKALVYTSPSHEPDRQRWRVLCPFSAPLSPLERSHMMARLNGVLGGVVADESFTLSQSYYFGHLVEAAEFRVEVVEGGFIDTCDELDKGAIGKSARASGDGGNGADDALDMAELTRRIMSGESLHPATVRLIGKMAADGVSREAATEYFSNLFIGAQQGRYRGRWPEMLKIIDWVYQREAQKGGFGHDTMGSAGFMGGAPGAGGSAQGPAPGTAGSGAAGAGGAGTAGASAGAGQAGPGTAGATASPWVRPGDWLANPPPLPEYVVEGLIPRRQVTLFSGHGAAGKSTVSLHLAAACALGRTWLDYPVMAGPALFVDAEDEEGVMYQRLVSVCKNFGCGLEDLDELYVLSLLKTDPVLAVSNRLGKVAPTALFKWLMDEARRIRPVVISLASSANMFAGNENDRPQVTQFIHLLGELAAACEGAVILISHPSRTGLTDGSGTSGSTGWHNAVRAQMYLEGVKDGEDEDNSDLRKLEFKKNQYGKAAAAITLRWQDGMFLPEGGQTDYEKAAAEAKADNVFLDLLKRFVGSGRRVSHKPTARNYAPTLFAQEPEAKLAKCGKAELAGAMRRLFAAEKIRAQRYGPPSRDNDEIVLV